MKYKDKKLIVDSLISQMDNDPKKFKFISGGGIDRKEVPTLSHSKCLATMDELRGCSNGVSLYFSRGFFGTLSSTWSIYVDGVYSFCLGFTLGFRVSSALSRLNKIKTEELRKEQLKSATKVNK